MNVRITRVGGKCSQIPKLQNMQIFTSSNRVFLFVIAIFCSHSYPPKKQTSATTKIQTQCKLFPSLRNWYNLWANKKYRKTIHIWVIAYNITGKRVDGFTISPVKICPVCSKSPLNVTKSAHALPPFCLELLCPMKNLNDCEHCTFIECNLDFLP
jgi:hypothetical protein